MGKDNIGITELPARLRNWVAGYPSMLATDADLARGTSRKGARTVRCERATRVVRAYTKDLVGNAETWVHDAAETVPNRDGNGNGNAQPWAMWQRVLTRDKGEAGRPKFSAQYRKRMMVKETPILPSGADAEGEIEELVYGATALEKTKRKGGIAGGLSVHEKRDSEEEGRWGSLAGKEWSMFEEGGFAGGAEIKDKLRFDLTESAKLVSCLPTSHT